MPASIPLQTVSYPTFHTTRLSFPSETLPVNQKRRSLLRIRMIELGDDKGSMGCQYAMNAARAAGFDVQWNERDMCGEWDVELVSLHHCLDFLKLADLPRRAPIRIVGGHPTVNNIRPAIPFGDLICLGEGEQWLPLVLARLEKGANAEDMADLPGTIIRSRWVDGAPIPRSLTVFPLPKHPPYLNVAKQDGRRGHARVWYVEMARGCPFFCSYCELGHAWEYRAQDTDFLLSAVDSIDTALSNRVSLFAPDEASHPGYAEILDRIHERKLITSFGSMRLDVIMRRSLPFKKNMLIRVGLDGLTEETRFRVHRKIKDDDVVRYFEYMTERGHVQFKIFMIFGYPWEQPQDFDEWANLMRRVRDIPRRTNANVRVKFTPFIPQPSTPLGDAVPRYDDRMVARINDWFALNKHPRREPGWFFVNDGILSRRSHALQVALTGGNERLLIERRSVLSHALLGMSHE